LKSSQFSKRDAKTWISFDFFRKRGVEIGWNFKDERRRGKRKAKALSPKMTLCSPFLLTWFYEKRISLWETLNTKRKDSKRKWVCEVKSRSMLSWKCFYCFQYLTRKRKSLESFQTINNWENSNFLFSFHLQLLIYSWKLLWQEKN